MQGAHTLKKMSTIYVMIMNYFSHSVMVHHLRILQNKLFIEQSNSLGISLDVMRDMGFSITPKVHGMEDHVVKQMRAIRGGIRELIEYWIEQYHQKGFKYDIKYKHMAGEHEKAVVRPKREKYQ